MVRCAACRDTFFVAGEPELTEEELAETEEFHAFLEQQPTAWPAADAPLAVEAESARSEPEAGPAAARLRLRLPSIPLAALARLAAVPKAPVLALILVGLVGGAVLGRERIVAAAPATARLYAAAHLAVNPLGLDLKGVRSELVLNGQDQLLVVEGEILNRRGRDIEVPSLRLTCAGPTALNFTPGRTSRRARHWRRPRPRASGRGSRRRRRKAGRCWSVSLTPRRVRPSRPPLHEVARLAGTPRVRVLFDETAIARRNEELAREIAGDRAQGPARRRGPEGQLHVRGRSHPRAAPRRPVAAGRVHPPVELPRRHASRPARSRSCATSRATCATATCCSSTTSSNRAAPSSSPRTC